ncbi:MAG: hypothetical protein LAP21_00110 [Acidobacteriia bacterium]|nr:hypothetical protein [Terriglobia bacterium]
MNADPVVLFQPQNHVGLGHINRLSAIAFALRRIDPGIVTPFVVEGAAHVLLDVLGLAYVPLAASHQMNVTEGWAAFSKTQRSALQLEVARAILRGLRPRVVVFDCFPNIEFASAVLEQKLPVVLCLREVKDWPNFLKRLTGLLDHVTQILIPHEAGSFELPEMIREKSLFVGEVTRPVASASQAARNAGRRIVINAGGGGYPGTVEFYNLAIQAVAELRRADARIDAHLIAGPLFNDWTRLKLADGVTVTPFAASTADIFAAASLVVCQAGYNTVAELRQLNVKTVLAPGQRVWDDQFSRARKTASECSRFRAFEGTSHIELAEMMRSTLDSSLSPQVERRMPQGAQRAAEYLRTLFR